MSYDFKQMYKDLYQPAQTPGIIQVPGMKFFRVEGKGNPNTAIEYQEAIEILYGLSYAIKMSCRNGHQIQGFFDYVVPPLEGLWWMDGEFTGVTQETKERFCWYALIRQPDFVQEEIFQWALGELARKKPHLQVTKAQLWEWEEGLCGQMMHRGPFDQEPETLEILHEYLNQEGYVQDINDTRYHHEIYLGDPRRTEPSRMRTVLRIPIRKEHYAPERS